MVSGRARITSVEEMRALIEQRGSTLNGHYISKDVIYVPKKASFNLSDDFLRMRICLVKDWPTKDVILLRKQTQFEGASKVERTVFKQEFDTVDEARAYIEAHFVNEFTFGFEYQREGWSYKVDDQQVYIEAINGLPPSIEAESVSPEQLAELFSKLGVLERYEASVAELIRRSLSREGEMRKGMK